MSIAGYLSAGKPELRMPKKDCDELGIRFEGPVVTGKKTVDEQLAGRMTEESNYYQSVDDYDPVLRAHCRL